MSQKKKFNSISVRLAFRFSLLVTAAVLTLSVSFIALLNQIVTAQKSEELSQAAEVIEKGLLLKEEQLDYEQIRLPYYISYTVYKSDDLTDLEDYTTIGTNDPYLPVLAITKRNARKHIEKNYFIDGDLNIFYYTRVLSASDSISSLVIQTALNMETDSFTRMEAQLPKGVLLLIWPILVLSFLVSLIITRRTIAPVKKITATARKLGSSNLDTLLPVSKHNDEIDDLAVTFNDLFTRLKKDFDRERQFTSDVSHELKTPVAVIMGQSNLLRRWGKDDPAQLTKSLDTIAKEAKSMSAIIENLLQISRIENGRIIPEFDLIPVAELFNRIPEEALSVKQDLEFEINVTGNGIIKADKELLHQVFTVIVSNSIKYCEAAEISPVKIWLSAKDIKDRCEITIRDNGKGFDEKTVLHAFERFYRGDEAHARKAGGSGLGLSIAQTIIEAMNGTIEASNAPEGGAVLTITLNKK